MIDTKVFENFKQKINKAKTIAAFSHINTDGDAVSSLLSLKEGLESIGKKVDVFVDSDIPTHVKFLKDTTKLNPKMREKYDLMIAVDCGDEARLGSFTEIFLKFKNTVQIDHHINNPNFAELNIIDSLASSTAEIIYDILRFLKITITPNMAELLLTGILTDTGGFRFQNTTSYSLKTASELLDIYGKSVSGIAEKVFSGYTALEYEAMKTAINGMRLFHDNRIAILTMRLSDYKRIGVKENDCQNFARLGLDISSVEASAVISESSPGVYKVSMRSKGNIDVASAAKSFGGGGHKNASGCKLYGDYETVVEKVVKSMWDGMV